MTPKEWAALLNGREYRNEITKDEEAQAKADGVVIVFGASDDIMELRGAINDEVYEDVLVNTGGMLSPCESNCRHYRDAERYAKVVEMIWDGGEGYEWTYNTDIPHETFDILDDGNKYCRGIVFQLSDAGL